jgi:hypothetical protein
MGVHIAYIDGTHETVEEDFDSVKEALDNSKNARTFAIFNIAVSTTDNTYKTKPIGINPDLVRSFQ